MKRSVQQKQEDFELDMVSPSARSNNEIVLNRRAKLLLTKRPSSRSFTPDTTDDDSQDEPSLKEEDSMRIFTYDKSSHQSIASNDSQVSGKCQPGFPPLGEESVTTVKITEKRGRSTLPRMVSFSKVFHAEKSSRSTMLKMFSARNLSRDDDQPERGTREFSKREPASLSAAREQQDKKSFPGLNCMFSTSHAVGEDKRKNRPSLTKMASTSRLACFRPRLSRSTSDTNVTNDSSKELTVDEKYNISPLYVQKKMKRRDSVIDFTLNESHQGVHRTVTPPLAS